MASRDERSPVPVNPQHHHASHLGIVRNGRETLARLQKVPFTEPKTFDAVIVPTVNNAGMLVEAARLAAAASCRLVVFCSGEIASRKGVADAVRDFDVVPELTVVDVPGSLEGLNHCAVDWLTFTTDSNKEALRGRYRDVALKRNLGILMARMCGWKHLVFLDDDVRVGDVDLLGDSWKILSDDPHLEAVGWTCGDESDDVLNSRSDNSAVCHAARFAGLRQDTFIGGGALAVRLTERTPFFPRVYNEDWLFLFDLIVRKSLAFAGRITQLVYDPFWPPDLGWEQEFGDILAEGLFRQFHEGGAVADSLSLDFWNKTVERRKAYISEILDQIKARKHGSGSGIGESVRTGHFDRVSDHLKRALKRTGQEGLAGSLKDYSVAWRKDLDRWAEVLASLPSVDHPGKALTELGLSYTEIPPRF